MNRSKCNCWACSAFKNHEPFCDGCDEKCCYKCAQARGACDDLELLCKGCDELSCLRCGDLREFPYDGKRYVVQALENKATAEAHRQVFITSQKPLTL